MQTYKQIGGVAAVLVIVGTVLISCGEDKPSPSAGIPRGAQVASAVTETPHYTITSTATDAQTTEVGAAVESLYTAYTQVFGEPRPDRRFQLVLYKDRDEFLAHNTSKSWAEAYYRHPRCYAYYSEGKSPYHWMIHEATHQLMWEESGYHSWKWIKEGVACYFGTSKLTGGVLETGTIDSSTYPIWWLKTFAITGNLQADIRAGRIIPLRDLMAGKGPDIDTHFNLYYVHYWSLSQFLFCYDNGRYATKYKQLIAAGGSPDDFERLIGPLDQLQQQWYDYLHQQVKAERARREAMELRRRDDALRQAFAKVEPGMTVGDVVKLMGGRPSEANDDVWAYPLSAQANTEAERDWRLLIRFADGKVTNKQTTYTCLLSEER